MSRFIKCSEAGYEESEIDLRVEFEQAADGKWYVVDCYTGWYGYDLPIGGIEADHSASKRGKCSFQRDTSLKKLTTLLRFSYIVS